MRDLRIRCNLAFPLVIPNKMGKLYFGDAQTSGDMCRV